MPRPITPLNIGSPWLYSSEFVWQDTPDQPLVIGLNRLTVTAAGLSADEHYVLITTPSSRVTAQILTYNWTTREIEFISLADAASGAWTISTATGGIQEAVRYAENTGGGGIQTEAGNTTLYATCNVSGSPGITIAGQGFWAGNIIADFPNGDVFTVTGGTQLVSFYNLMISGNNAHSGGFGIRFKDLKVGSPVISNVRINDCYGGVWMDSSGGLTANNLQVIQETNLNCRYGFRTSGARCSDIELIGGHIKCPQGYPTVQDMMDMAISIESADGIVISGMMIRGGVGVYIVGVPGGGVGSVLLSDLVIDNCGTHNVYVESSDSVALFNNIRMAGCHAIGTLSGTDSVKLNLYNIRNRNQGVILANNLIGNTGGDGVFINGGNDVVMSGNRIADNANAAIRMYNCSNFSVSGNVLSGGVNNMYLGGDLTTGTINGNVGYKASGQPLVQGATMSGVNLYGNPGMN